MTTLYPVGLDNFENPTGDESMAGKENGVVVHPGVLHSAQHSNTNDAIEAIESYIGIVGSVDLNSLTYKLDNLGLNLGNFVTNTELSVAINTLVGAAPGALDTLEELATALGDNPNFATTVTNSLASKAPALLATSVKTSNYTAAASEYVPVDTTSGVIVITLPTAPANGSIVAVKRVIGATNAVTVNTAGSDVFNISGGATTASVAVLNQQLIFRYKTTGAIWYLETSLSLGGLDGRYVALTGNQTVAGIKTFTNGIQLGDDAGNPNIILTSETNAVVNVLQLGVDGSGVLKDQHLTTSDQIGTGKAASFVLNPGFSNGVNQDGADVTLASGGSTGSGAGGTIYFMVSTAGTSGSGPNIQAKKWRIDTGGHMRPENDNEVWLGQSYARVGKGFFVDLALDGTVTLSSTTNFTGSPLAITRSATTDVAISTKVTGDTTPRLQINADGKINLGPGNAAADVSLYHYSAGQLGITGNTVLSGVLFGLNEVVANYSLSYQVIMGAQGPAGEPGLHFGSGLDTNLYRKTTSTLQTDGSLQVGNGSSASNVNILANNYAGVSTEVDDNTGSPYSLFYRARGTAAAKAQVVGTDFLGSFGWRGYTNSGAFGIQDAARMSAVANESFTSTAQGASLVFYAAPNGTVGAAERLRIEGNSGISISGGELDGVYTQPTIKLHYNNNIGYNHVIHTRHTGGLATGNAIDFYTNDGTGSPAFPTNAVHGLSVNNGQIGLAGVFTPSAILHLPAGTTAAGGIKFGTDTTLYRVTANNLKTDGSLQAGGEIYADVGTLTQVYIGAVSSKAGFIFSSLTDTNLYRDSAGVLKTDTAFVGGTTIKALGNTGANTNGVTLTGANATGSPSTGAHVVGELSGDNTGKLWYCTVAGTPGTWVNTGGSATVTDADYGDIVITSGVWTIDTNVVTNSKSAQMAAHTYKGNNTGSTANPIDVTLAQLKTELSLSGTNTGDQTITLTSDVTGTGTGSFATTIATGVVTNAKLATVAANSFKGNNTGSTAAPIDMTVAQAKTLLAIAESDVSGLTTDLTNRVTTLTATAVKTTAYSANANELIPCDTTSAGFTVTLPTAPADNSRVWVKLVTQSSTNAVTIAAGGSDVFNKSGGPTTKSVNLIDQELQLVYKSGIWYTMTGIPLSSLDLRFANLASPTFTGTPAAPTAAQGTNTTQLATTAMVHSEVVLLATLASPTLTGTPAAPTAAANTNTTQLATTAFVTTADNLKANLASPTFTGTPLSTTAAQGTNTTQIATTAMVHSEVVLLAPATATVGTGLGTTGTINLDMSTLDGTYQSMGALTGAITFTTSNRAAGKTVTIKIINGSTLRAFTFPAWIFVGAAAPASIAASKTAILTVTFFDNTDAAAVAAYSAQP